MKGTCNAVLIQWSFGPDECWGMRDVSNEVGSDAALAMGNLRGNGIHRENNGIQEEPNFTLLSNPTLHCCRMVNRFVIVQGTALSRSACGSCHHPNGVIIRAGDYAFFTPYVPLEQNFRASSFQWRPKFGKNMVYQLEVHSYNSFLFCLIPNCFKHPKLAIIAYFSIKLCRSNQVSFHWTIFSRYT